MSKTLLEANFQTTDLRAVYTRKVSSGESTTTNTPVDVDAFAAKLVKLDFSEDTIKRLLNLGKPFKQACEIIGFNDRNPILAFVKLEFVQNSLLKTGLLNAGTFKAIYNAVAKKLVADSEFFDVRDYNIIYCPDLYRKSAKEIEEYLTLQRSILSPTTSSYDGKIQLKNRATFLTISDIKDTGSTEYAKKVKANEADLISGDKIPKTTNARINSIEVARLISGHSTENTTTVTRSNKELTDIVNKLNTLADKFAAILSLSTSTASSSAKQALNNSEFSGIDSKEIAKAFLKLSTDSILPKGQLQTKDADALVSMILATLAPDDGAKH